MRVGGGSATVDSMGVLVRNLAIALDAPDAAVLERAARRLRVPAEQIERMEPVRRSIDARRGREPRVVFDVEVSLIGGKRHERKVLQRLHRADVSMARHAPPPMPVPGTEPLPERPVVIGFGPAGMFAALVLAELGYRPLVLERGRDVRRRHADIMRDFYQLGRFHPESNLLFGEGGAGAYSDGKLYTRVNDPRCKLVLESFVEFGADPDILIAGRPHVGSDRIPGICRRIRLRIEELGGEVRFDTRVDDFEIEDAAVRALRVGSRGERVAVGPVFLAIGHSARDTVRRLVERGVTVAAKSFQLGLRIEHPQTMVDRWQYGAYCEHPRLPPAEYHLVAQGAGGVLGDVFSFCMCPGGQILPTNESAGQVATNGASRASRAGRFANAGLVLTMGVDTIENDPLAGLAYQEHWERTAYALTGATYRVPCQRATDFLAGRASDGELLTSYPLGGQWCRVEGIIPGAVAGGIRRALETLDRRMPGFAGGDAVLTGPETRASAPVRIVRNAETFESVSTRNLYPIGEGAGYAGGIVSAAVDGIKAAEHVIARYAPPR
jgi:uncharacterized FAD-dependent dehydrogenase